MPVLGGYYKSDHGPLLKAIWRDWTLCRWVGGGGGFGWRGQVPLLGTGGGGWEAHCGWLLTACPKVACAPSCAPRLPAGTPRPTPPAAESTGSASRTPAFSKGIRGNNRVHAFGSRHSRPGSSVTSCSCVAAVVGGGAALSNRQRRRHARRNTPPTAFAAPQPSAFSLDICPPCCTRVATLPPASLVIRLPFNFAAQPFFIAIAKTTTAPLPHRHTVQPLACAPPFSFLLIGSPLNSACL